MSRDGKEPKIHHHFGEIVIGTLGNFLENPNASRKGRPMVVLSPGPCQHLVAGLTTKPFYKTTGAKRVRIPNPEACGLSAEGYLWSTRPARISRLDIRKHIGWVDDAMVDVIADTMHVQPEVIARLRSVAAEHHNPDYRLDF
jgi:hypothetical protein